MNRGENNTLPQGDYFTRSVLIGKATAALMELNEDERLRVLSQFAEKYGWKL